ncbi:MAG: hypothetical protein BWY25_02561 [Chloroflexi bacterium ADurb.Bin222]|nr:MAG: hypothetical protein BWY25_02561 [Chloroflexi bacterium ADurb.Bin222]
MRLFRVDENGAVKHPAHPQLESHKAAHLQILEHAPDFRTEPRLLINIRAYKRALTLQGCIHRLPVQQRIDITRCHGLPFARPTIYHTQLRRIVQRLEKPYRHPF